MVKNLTRYHFKIMREKLIHHSKVKKHDLIIIKGLNFFMNKQTYIVKKAVKIKLKRNETNDTYFNSILRHYLKYYTSKEYNHHRNIMSKTKIYKSLTITMYLDSNDYITTCTINDFF